MSSSLLLFSVSSVSSVPSALPSCPSDYLRLLHEAAFEGEGGGGDAVGDAEFAEDAADVLVHGAAADREVVGDLLIARALDEIAQHVRLARRDAVRLRRVDGVESGTERVELGRQVRRAERGDDRFRRREGVAVPPRGPVRPCG